MGAHVRPCQDKASAQESGDVENGKSLPSRAISEGGSRGLGDESLASQPVASQPLASQAVASQPVASQPVASQPVASQPAGKGIGGKEWNRREALAGAVAGMATVAILHPLDIVRTRFQVNDGRDPSLPRYRGIISAITTIARSEGVRGLYAGLYPSMVGSSLSWALYFFLYSHAKERYGAYFGALPRSRSSCRSDPSSHSGGNGTSTRITSDSCSRSNGSSSSSSSSSSSRGIQGNSCRIQDSSSCCSREESSSDGRSSSYQEHMEEEGSSRSIATRAASCSGAGGREQQCSPSSQALAAAPLEGAQTGIATNGRSGDRRVAATATRMEHEEREGSEAHAGAAGEEAQGALGAQGAQRSGDRAMASGAAGEGSPRANGNQELEVQDRRGATMVNLIAAAETGVLVVLLTNPIWLAKTRLQLQGAIKPIASQGAVAPVPNTLQGASTAVGGLLSQSAVRGVSPVVPPSQASVHVHPRQYRGFHDAIWSIVREEGVRGLYRGIGPSLILVSHGAIQMAAYEELKQFMLILRSSTSPSAPRPTSNSASSPASPAVADLSPWDIAAVGAAAKLCAASVTYPYQVIRARLQMRPNEAGQLKYSNTWHAMTSMWCLEGARGFYKGFLPNLLRVMPSASVTFAVYEVTLRFLKPRHYAGV